MWVKIGNKIGFYSIGGQNTDVNNIGRQLMEAVRALYPINGVPTQLAEDIRSVVADLADVNK